MRDYPDALVAMARVRPQGHAGRGQDWQLDTQDKLASYCSTKRKNPLSPHADLGSLA